MSWNLTQLEVEQPGSPASSFSFELHLPQGRSGQRIVAGDGVVLTRLNRVMVNRERELLRSLLAAGADSESVLLELRERVLTAARPQAAA